MISSEFSTEDTILSTTCRGKMEHTEIRKKEEEVKEEGVGEGGVRRRHGKIRRRRRRMGPMKRQITIELVEFH